MQHTQLTRLTPAQVAPQHRCEVERYSLMSDVELRASLGSAETYEQRIGVLQLYERARQWAIRVRTRSFLKVKGARQ